MQTEPYPSSPPPSSKTHAFFSSSFAASPPPRPPPSLRRKESDDSNASTSSSTGTPTHTNDHSSPSTRSIFSPTSPGFHISRIFPSRYTSTSNSRDSSEARDVQSTHRLRRKPQFLSFANPHDDSLSDSIESTSGYSYNSFTSYGSEFSPRSGSLGFSAEPLLPLPTPAFEYERARNGAAEVDAPLSSASSSTSSSSSHVSIRLPTPPPPPLLTPAKFSQPSSTSDSDTSEFTPRPSSYEPSLGSLLRPFDPAPISKAPSMVSTVSTAATEDSHDHGSDAQEAGELHEGDIIASTSASHPTSPTTQTSYATSPPSLRLLEPLGQGAFSAVWLAEDLSAVPLMLTSKRSVRDLKRQASVHSKGGLSRNGSVKSTVSRKGSLKASGREVASLRKTSISKLKARLKGMKPVGVGKEVLEEHVGSGKLKMYLDEHGRFAPSPLQTSKPSSKTHRKDNSAGSLDVTWGTETPPSLSRSSSTRTNSARTGSHPSSSTSRVVAVKLTPRKPDPYTTEAEERTRIGFVREVEVLRHISHPNITPLLSFFSTPTHHVLVLPYLHGGDLLSLVNDDRSWNNLTEGVLRRIWCELCRAVGWMHSVGLVHRDVKLENILLTWDGLKASGTEAPKSIIDHEKPICCSPPQMGILQSFSEVAQATRTRPSVDDLPTPLIKLTDFGLSRFIDIGNGERGQGELLSTRCGSEAYAAPELVMGGSSVYTYATQSDSPPKPPVSERTGVYDARDTDSWACGVVLYALVARKLPFGEGVGVDGVVGGGRASHIGGERAPGFGSHGKSLAAERRQWLMRIARGEWQWPEAPAGEVEKGAELVGPQLARCEGARRIVGRLLVRDPRKRARIVELWEDEWVRADAVGAGMYEATQGDISEGAVDDLDSMKIDGAPALGEGDWEPLDSEVDELGDESEEDEAEDEDDGWLLDEEGIGSIARQEVV